MKKRLLAIALTIAILFSFSVPAFASRGEIVDGWGEEERPATEVTKSYDTSSLDPIGSLTEEEAREMSAAINAVCIECDNEDSMRNPLHLSITPHYHTITRINRSYTGQIDRGIQAVARSVPYTTQLSLSNSFSVSNSFSTNIGFEKGVVSGGVGFDVSFITEKSTSYTVDVPKNTKIGIRLYDMYTVKEFDCKTTYVVSGTHPGAGYSYTENGTGWAQQWIRFDYRAEKM